METLAELWSWTAAQTAALWAWAGAVLTQFSEWLAKPQIAFTRIFSAARRAQGDVNTLPSPAPRIAVIGGPGSGKSVALRLIARDG